MSDTCLCQTKTVTLHKDIFMRSHVNELVNEVKNLIEKGVSSLDIDFKEVETIDIVGFGILSTVQKISLTNNVSIKLFNVRENVRKILKNTCLILDIEDEGEEKSFIHEEIALIA